MRFVVDVQWPGNHYKGVLTDTHPRSNLFANATPILVFGGTAYKPVELDPEAEVIVTWWMAKTGPVWKFIQRAIDEGYPIKIKPT